MVRRGAIVAYCKGLPLSRPAARPPALRRPSAAVVAVAVDSGGNSAIVQFVLFWTVLPSESMFTAFAGDVSLHGLRMSVLAIALCVALSLMVWTVLVRIALRRGNLDLLLIPYVLLGLCATKYFSMHHIGIIWTVRRTAVDQCGRYGLETRRYSRSVPFWATLHVRGPHVRAEPGAVGGADESEIVMPPVGNAGNILGWNI